MFTLYTGPKPPSPSLLSFEKLLVASIIVERLKKGSSKSRPSSSSSSFSAKMISDLSSVSKWCQYRVYIDMNQNFDVYFFTKL
jgi:hypothetical protein